MMKDSLTSEIMLFGVRVNVDPMRKSVSMNNLSQYQHPLNNNNNNSIVTNEEEANKVVVEDNGYASADDVVNTGRCMKERKRGVPWTEEEHKLFLLGLQKVGKGDWRGISRNFVKTRTPTQVASHAQKYFLRKNNLNRRRRRSSLFDITTDSVSGMPMEECNDQEDNYTRQVTAPVSLPVPETPRVTSHFNVAHGATFPVSYGQMMLQGPIQNPIEAMTFGKVEQSNSGSSMLVHPVSIPTSRPSPNVDLNSNHLLGMESTRLSLKLSLSSGQGQSSSTTRSTYQLMPSFSNGESIISVA